MSKKIKKDDIEFKVIDMRSSEGVPDFIKEIIKNDPNAPQSLKDKMNDVDSKKAKCNHICCDERIGKKFKETVQRLEAKMNLIEADQQEETLDKIIKFIREV